MIRRLLVWSLGLGIVPGSSFAFGRFAFFAFFAFNRFELFFRNLFLDDLFMDEVTSSSTRRRMKSDPVCLMTSRNPL